MSSITPPDWLKEECDDEYTKSIRNAMIRFLYDSHPNDVVEDVGRLIRPIEVWRCEMTTLFALFKLLKAKNVDIPEQSNQEVDLQIVHSLMSFLFPNSLDVYLRKGFHNYSENSENSSRDNDLRGLKSESQVDNTGPVERNLTALEQMESDFQEINNQRDQVEGDDNHTVIIQEGTLIRRNLAEAVKTLG